MPFFQAFGDGYDANAASYALESPFLLDDDGYIVKNMPQTVMGDRTGMNDKLYYEVLPGESLSEIAYKFGLKSSTLIWINNISNPNSLRKGQKLIIPPVNGVEHTVKSGESVASIAKKYKVDESKIISQNRLDSAVIHKGQKIFIPDGKMVSPPKPKFLAKKGYNYNNVGNNRYATATGGKSVNVPAAGKMFITPTKGVLTQGFRRGHYAIDIGNTSRPPVYAAANGVVTRSRCDRSGYGCYVIIAHPNNFKSLYAHCSHLYVKVDEQVSQGQSICKMGNTGRVRGPTGIHLHFEIIKNGVKQNPLWYL